MMKASAKRRRTKQQIIEDKERERQQKADIEAKLAQFQQMEQRMAQMEAQLHQAEEMHDDVTGLIKQGIL